MSLQNEYRPIKWKEMYGNKEVINAIQAALQRKNHNHCFLLTGDSGCGKTTTAYLIADALGVYDHGTNNNPNFREINASDFKGIDMVRQVRRESASMPLSGNYRVYLFDECHKLTGDAQEALLKLMEGADDTPNYYIFGTTNPEMLKPTFKRRCAAYQLQLLTEKDIFDLLADICDYEKAKHVSDDVLDQIAQDCTGSPGIAVGILDAIIGLGGDEMLAAAKKQASLQNQVIDLCRVLAKKAKWSDVAKVLQGLQGEDAEGIRRKVLGYAASVLLKKDDPRMFLVLDAFCEPVYNSGYPGIVRACYMALNA